VSDEIRVDAMPAYAVGTLDFDKLGPMIGEAVAAVDSEYNNQVLEAIQARACTFQMAGPDDHGYFTADVIYDAEGCVIGRTRIHWSKLVAGVE
jgi:hypothetical protein